jgi:hypothetical protein
MYSMALWFWSTVAVSGFVLAGLASTVSFAAPRLVSLSLRFVQRTRRAATSLHNHAERVSRPSLVHHIDSILPSHPSHPSNPRTC